LANLKRLGLLARRSRVEKVFKQPCVYIYMDKKELAALRAKFLKLVASVPQPLRTDTIGIIDDEPYSWSIAYAEVKQNTKTGNKILVRLKEIGVL